MAVGVDEFIRLIGAVIHDCGLLELYTNNVIQSLAKDPLRLRKMVALPFRERIKKLRRLLHERKSLPREDVDALCDELSKIAERRNDVAHNPIVSDDQSSYILVVRYKFDPPKIEKITEAGLRSLLKRLTEAEEKFAELLPETIEL